MPVKHGSYATITASVVLDRLISLWALFFLPSLCAVFARVEVPFFSRAVLLWWGVGLVLVTAALFSGIGPHLLRGLLISQFSVIQRLIHLWDVLSQDRRLLVWSFVIGEAAQLLAVASSVLILRAVGQVVAFWDAGLISVLIRIGAMLPITINGIGLRENLATSLVTLLGATREDGLLLAFTSYLFGLVISLAGVLPILGFNNLRLTGGWSHEH